MEVTIMTKCVLLLEDNAGTRESMAALLRHAGHTVIVARNAMEAQVLWDEHSPDTIIADINLPGMRGDLWALFLADLSPDTQMVFVSGAPKTPQLEHCDQKVTFLSKPIDAEKLLDIIEEGSNRTPVLAGV